MSEKKKKKWSWWPFDWHFWPDSEQLKIDSAYKIGFLSLLLFLGLYIYEQFNEVRVVNADIKAACLDRNIYYNVQDSDSIYRYRKISGSAMAEIIVRLPMTNREEEIHRYQKDTLPNLINITFYKDTSKYYYDDVNRHIYYFNKLSSKGLRDSLSKNVYEIIEREKKINKLQALNFLGVQNSISNWGWNIDSPTLKAKFDSVTKNKASDTIKHPLFYSSEKIYIKENVFNKNLAIRFNDLETLILDTFPRHNSDSIIKYIVQTHGKDKLSKYIESECFYSNSHKEVIPENKVEHEYRVESPFHSPILGNPGWFALEDISQQYYNLNIKTLGLDSLILKVDFVGAADFSKMSPMPDEIDMNSISFYSRSKLIEIERHGLTFHVAFKELQNKQNIRLFFLTSIIGGIIIILIVFLIMVIHILFKKYKVKGKWRPWVRRFYMLLLLYFIIVYIFFSNYWDKGNNYILWGVPIPIAFLVALFLKYFTLLAKVIIHNPSIDLKMTKSHKKTLIVLLLCMVFCGSLILLGKQYLDYNDIDKMEARGNYNRAVNLMCDKIIKKDSITLEDYNRMLKLLSNLNNTSIKNTQRVEYYEDEGLLLVQQKDTVTLLDIEKERKYVFLMPGNEMAHYRDKCVWRWATADSIYIAQIENSSSVNKFSRYGFGWETADNGNYLITKKDSVLSIYKQRNNLKLIKEIKDQYCVANKGDLLAIENFSGDSIKFYKLPVLNLVSVIPRHGTFTMFYGSYFINNGSGNTYFYDINDGMSLKYTLKGNLGMTMHFPVLNGNMQVYTHNDNTTYFHTLYQDSVSTDSVNYFVNIRYESAPWNNKIIQLLKKITINGNTEVFSFIKDGVVFRDTRSNEITTYDIKHGEVPVQKIKCPIDHIVKKDNNLYFCVFDDSCYNVYDSKHFLYKKQSNGFYFKDGFFVKMDSAETRLTPIDNLSAEYILKVQEKYKERIYNIHILKGWVYINESNFELYNILDQNIEELIMINKFLSKNKKIKLIKKMRNFKGLQGTGI